MFRDFSFLEPKLIMQPSSSVIAFSSGHQFLVLLLEVLPSFLRPRALIAFGDHSEHVPSVVCSKVRLLVSQWLEVAISPTSCRDARRRSRRGQVASSAAAAASRA